MIKRDVFEYFKKEPDVMQVKDVVRLLHCRQIDHRIVFALVLGESSCDSFHIVKPPL